MKLLKELVTQHFFFVCVLILCAVSAAFAQTGTATLRGKLTDELGGAIVGATVTATDAAGTTKTVTSDNGGNYVFAELTPGRYAIRANAPNFAPYENAQVDVAPGRTQPLDIQLSVTLEQQQVNVSADNGGGLSVEPTNNGSAIVLREADLASLPDDPDDLQAALQALAGPSAGPNGGQIYIDGFTGGRFPPKESIREIRINSNPFSAEYDRLGFGRIEILTKPGSDKYRGTGFFNFTDESLNSRNPFETSRAPYQRRRYGGNLSGPIVAKKASFFLDFERNETNDQAIIVATILDQNLKPVPFNSVFFTPTRRTTFSPRFDYQLNDKNTVVGRYTFAEGSSIGGVGGFSLASRATTASSTEHTVQLTETAILNAKTVNETRFQYIHRRNTQNGDGTQPTIVVQDAFTGGGSNIGLSFNTEDRIELQNYTTLSLGNHSVKFGGRLRDVKLTDVSQSNFNGTFVFTSLNQYQQFLQGVAGVTPTQFTISGGNPRANVSQYDFGGFVQDDWRYRPNLTFNLGLRYETQNNIHDKTDFAPRLGFAWSPGAAQGQPAKTVLRGGFGIFYDRFAESLVLNTIRNNGVNQQRYIVQNPTFYINNIPTISQLQALQLPQNTFRIAPDLRTPYTMEGVFSIERQLPYKMTFTATYIANRTLHLLRSRDINAPLPGTVVLDARGRVISAQYPFGAAAGNIFEYESNGRLNQNQLLFQVRSNFSTKFSFAANYVFSKSNSDTDGAGTFPANQYNLSGEYGRASFDVRHRFFMFGSYTAPFNIRVSPFIIASSGAPFNIVTGVDTNGDTLFTERPTFAQLAQACAARQINASYCNISGVSDPNAIIPRNYGQAPGFFAVNLRLAKTFGFGDVVDNPGGRRGGGGGGGRGGRGGGGFGGGPFGGGRGGGGGGDTLTEKRYNLTVGVQVSNLFNNVNFGRPSGNLLSPYFGRSLAIVSGFGRGDGLSAAAGNRTVELQMRFNF